MIELVKGDIFKSECQALVNPVNCDGVMGAGLALKFKKKFPHNFYDYETALKIGELKPGKVFTCLYYKQEIINFPTKNHWRDNSTYTLITTGLDALQKEIKERGIKSVAVPALGCGLGGLNWNDVLPLIETRLGEDKLPGVLVKVYPPK